MILYVLLIPVLILNLDRLVVQPLKGDPGCDDPLKMAEIRTIGFLIGRPPRNFWSLMRLSTIWRTVLKDAENRKL